MKVAIFLPSRVRYETYNFKRFCSEISSGVAELKKHGFDHTNSARRSRLEGSWEPGEGQIARSGDFGWAGSGIWARGEGLERSKR